MLITILAFYIQKLFEVKVFKLWTCDALMEPFVNLGLAKSPCPQMKRNDTGEYNIMKTWRKTVLSIMK